MKKLLYAVAVGEKYEHQSRVMIDSFRQYNKDWETKIFNEKELNFILPRHYYSKDAFFKCEIGRWYIMKHVILNHYDVALYCDNDMYWYGEYPVSGRAFTLSPHYITDSAKRDAIHWLVKDGIPNLGMFESTQSEEAVKVVDVVINEVSANPLAHYHGAFLWLQNLASYLPHLGYDVGYMTDPGLNVARWNLAHHDRSLSIEDGALMVTCGGVKTPLRSFHFSSKSIHSLDRFGEVAGNLRDEYLKRIS